MAFLNCHYPTSIKATYLVGAGVLLVSIACHILCLATPYYFTLSNSDARKIITESYPNVPDNFTFGIHYGLWLVCVDGGNATSQYKCYHLRSNVSNEGVISPDWLIPSQTLAIVGLLIAAFAVFSLIAFIFTEMDRLPYCFLVTAAVSCIVGGIIILSSDIAFAVEKTISFYAATPMDEYFFPKEKSPYDRVVLTQRFDNRFTAGWSFILDVISGSLCIMCGPIFVFIALKLDRNESAERKRPNDHTQ